MIKGEWLEMNQDSIIIQCSNCETKNRIPKTRLDEKPLCGKCGGPLEFPALYDHPVDLTDRSFNREVMSFPGVVLVDCWAPWCGPCRIIAPIIEKLASDYAGRVKIGKLNIDKNPLISLKYSIQSIPTLLLFKGGELVNTLVGALPEEEIKGYLDSVL